MSTLPDPRGSRSGSPSSRSTPSAASVPAGRLILAGTSHHVAPVAVREQLLGKAGERAAERLGEALRQQLGPAVILSTCNRLEVYCWTAQPRAVSRLARLLCDWSGLPARELRPHLYVHTQQAAAQHLIRVAAGLDSLALGETEILGQVRAAWRAAAAAGPLGPEINALFTRAVEAARRIRTAGGLARHPSLAVIAAGKAGEMAGGLRGRRCAVLGAGITGKTAARGLLEAGAARVTLLNRSLERARAAAEWLGGASAASLDALPQLLLDVDVVICATAAPRVVIDAVTVARALAARPERPLVIVDVAVPRDVDPAVRDLPGVRLIDLDDLAADCAVDSAGRTEALARAEALAREAALAYTAALRNREAVPDIVALRGRAEVIRQGELRRVAGKLAQLSPRERAVVEQLTHTITQKLLHGPTMALRQTAALPRPAAQRRRAAILEAMGAHAPRTTHHASRITHHAPRNLEHGLPPDASAPAAAD